jgi:hypothetical protein
MSEKQEPQATGVCQECWIVSGNLELHLLDEHGIKPSAERLAEIEKAKREDALRQAERMVANYGERGSGESACLVGIKG